MGLVTFGSIAGIILIVFGYKQMEDQFLWLPFAPSYELALYLMPIAAILLVAGNMPCNISRLVPHSMLTGLASACQWRFGLDHYLRHIWRLCFISSVLARAKSAKAATDLPRRDCGGNRSGGLLGDVAVSRSAERCRTGGLNALGVACRPLPKVLFYNALFSR